MHRHSSLRVLNCGSLDETLASLARILGTETDALRQALLGARIGESSRIAPEDQLLTALGFGSREELPAPDRVRWFHFTRVPADTSFREGLLPTGRVIESIWQNLGEVATELVDHDRWEAFRQGFRGSGSQFAKQLAIKSPKEFQGPFGFLVRAAGEGVASVHKDFATMSEVAEDICAGFKEQTGVDLADEWRRRARPCVVVFEAPPGEIGQHAVHAALMYAHHSLHGLEQGVTCNTCFDGGGDAVPREYIVSVEWPSTP